MNQQQLISWGLTALTAYLCGAVPWAYIIGKINGIDIRQHGSGNIGATNVRRVLGKKWGIPCFILDFLKGLLPVLAVRLLSNRIPELGTTAVVIAVIMPIVGHNFSVFIGFKGGKGVSTSAGALAALVPWAVLAALAVWAGIFQVSRYVSLASICAAISLPAAAVIIAKLTGAEIDTAVVVLLSVCAALTVIRHRENIVRLINGTENKFVKKKREER